MTPPRWLLALACLGPLFLQDGPAGYACECVASLNGETTGADGPRGRLGP